MNCDLNPNVMDLPRSRDCSQRMMENNDNRMLKPQHHYDTSMFHFLSNENQDNSPFVILPKNDYESIKKELTTVKQSLSDFKNLVTFEIQQLKQDNTELMKQVEKCKCDQQQAELLKNKNNNNNNNNSNTNNNNSSNNNSMWNMENGWENTKPMFSGVPMMNDVNNLCSPITSTPDRCRVSGEITDINASGLLGMPKIESIPPPDNKLVQLLPNYDIFVNKLNLQIVVNEGLSHKDNGALYVLRRLIPLVFTWEELAFSRGQGLNCKSTEDVSNKFPLDPTKVLACKAYMRKFCLESGCLEPPERAINQTFSHQVNYARRRIRDAKEPKIPSMKKQQKRGRKPKIRLQGICPFKQAMEFTRYKMR
ncbi:hypothetical protein HELRODRAFT_180534 [Helobdella robusta]|uniref:BEN domain-containing protein n=1 Tax=Helobdella robusta TaxID=6412 RepID=T1FG12_HELRO|nr:hypothetical protein HELRODRAFT_180534 [Helobdella robusta]ESN93882.1 hypothetical protein HELRODRAFT_180534 [Helobdella robusta]